MLELEINKKSPVFKDIATFSDYIKNFGYVNDFVEISEVLAQHFEDRWQELPKSGKSEKTLRWYERKGAFRAWAGAPMLAVDPSYETPGVRTGALWDTFLFTHRAMLAGSATRTVAKDFVTLSIDVNRFVGRYPDDFFEEKTALGYSWEEHFGWDIDKDLIDWIARICANNIIGFMRQIGLI